jgi:glycerol kinase
VLPRIVPSSGVLGDGRRPAGPCAIPIAGVAGDQQAATFGQACFAPGMAKNTYGTGCFMLMNTGSVPGAQPQPPADHRGLAGPEQARPAHRVLPGRLGLHGRRHRAVAARRLQLIQSAAEVEALAASVDDTGDISGARLRRPGRARLGRPCARHAGGADARHHARHIARAALEAIALQSADVFGAMSRDAGIALTELRVDGGASRNDLLMQMQADLLGVPVVRPQVTETTALGAACLAGLATGWPSRANTTSPSSAAAPPAWAWRWTPRQRGHSVVLIEAHDFAKGTSSRATKLVHGGVRYLAQGNIRWCARRCTSACTSCAARRTWRSRWPLSCLRTSCGRRLSTASA